jgi:glycosyltransferase involved in cell wall biosynthesis
MEMPGCNGDPLRVGFVSTRLAGTDGVSLEAYKWSRVLKDQMKAECFYYGGELATPEKRSMVVAEAHFKHEEVWGLHQRCFGVQSRPREVTETIHRMRCHLRGTLQDFIERYELTLLIAENIFSLPLHLPLALALAEIISEQALPTIAHHHDFYWERHRLMVNAVWEYINMAFPPHLPSVQHVVINSSAEHQLSLRTGIAGTVIPNVIDFETPPAEPDEYAADLRRELGVGEDEIFVLQPTRVVPRKAIEHSIELCRRLGPEAKLVISHAGGDEEAAYEERVRNYAEMLGVDAIFVSERISDHRGRDAEGRKVYALSDVYPQADLVTYPSAIEGFGNAFLETIYYRKPIVVNTYAVYQIDIKPKGFDCIEFRHYVGDETVRQVREVLENSRRREEMVEKNYRLGRQHYSYQVLEKRLQSLVTECSGD